MPKILTGSPANVLTPFIETITAIANNGSGACRVTTSVAHEFGDGDTVLITGTTQTNLDNLYWTIAVIDATHFDLIGSTFSATHTGTATDVSLLPAIQCPLDGEAPTMTTMLPVLQALMDRTQFLQAKLRLNNRIMINSNTLACYTGGAGWGALAAYDSVLADGHVEVNDFVPGVLPGDIIDVTVAMTMKWFGTSGIGKGNVRLEFLETGAGGTSTTPFTPATDQAYAITSGTAQDTNVPLTLRGSAVVGTTGNFRIYLNGHVLSNQVAADWYLLGGVLSWQQYRVIGG
jgi:hypothetical protein